MRCIQGKIVFEGIAIGKIAIYDKEEQTVKRTKIADVSGEIKRYEEARNIAVNQLNEVHEKAIKTVGELNAQIFEVHAMMLEDEDYNDSVKNIISTQSVNAEFAVAKTGDNFAKMFQDMEDEYFKARSSDVKDISERVIAVLNGKEYGTQMEKEPVIVAAKDLAPSETVQMDKEKLLAFVTASGSKNSHTAILARSMGIPAVIGVEITKEWNGCTAIVDGYTGKVYLDPDEETFTEMEKKRAEVLEKKTLLLNLKGKESITSFGKKIHLYGNIGGKSDVANVLSNDAEGIGLFRTEFIYLERDDYPTEQDQFQIYKYVAETMAGKKVIIRTLDIGADKQVGYFQLGHEDNPAMGYRAIRICLDRTEVFKTQLRAILRASSYGNISIMFPMIISLDEVLKSKKLLEEVKEELCTEGISYGQVEVGVMIETPAAVMISEELAREVDFFSIGTNDLTQYTLAIDRQNPKLDNIYDAHHPAVLKMIQMVIDNGHKGGAWVGICGELGADLTLTKTFIDMGIDELSVSPSMVLNVRNEIRKY